MERNAIYTQAGRKKLGQLIRTARGSHSYRELENITGVSDTVIRRLELGDINTPDAITLVRLAHFMRCPKEDLEGVLFEQPLRGGLEKIGIAEEIFVNVKQLSIPEIARLNAMISKYLFENLSQSEFNGFKQELGDSADSNVKIDKVH